MGFRCCPKCASACSPKDTRVVCGKTWTRCPRCLDVFEERALRGGARVFAVVPPTMQRPEPKRVRLAPPPLLKRRPAVPATNTKATKTQPPPAPADPMVVVGASRLPRVSPPSTPPSPEHAGRAATFAPARPPVLSVAVLFVLCFGAMLGTLAIVTTMTAQAARAASVLLEASPSSAASLGADEPPVEVIDLGELSDTE